MVFCYFFCLVTVGYDVVVGIGVVCGVRGGVDRGGGGGGGGGIVHCE